MLRNGKSLILSRVGQISSGDGEQGGGVMGDGEQKALALGLG